MFFSVVGTTDIDSDCCRSCCWPLCCLAKDPEMALSAAAPAGSSPWPRAGHSRWANNPFHPQVSGSVSLHNAHAALLSVLSHLSTTFLLTAAVPTAAGSSQVARPLGDILSRYLRTCLGWALNGRSVLSMVICKPACLPSPLLLWLAKLCVSRAHQCHGVEGRPVASFPCLYLVAWQNAALCLPPPILRCLDLI